MEHGLITLLLQGAALGTSAAASPGPLQTLLVGETLLGGFRRSFPILFAPLATDLPILALMVLLLRQLPPEAERVLALAGGLYVLNLAWGLHRQWRKGAGSGPGPAREGSNPWTMLRRAVVMNFLNPNPYLFWGLVGGPILLGAMERSALHAGAFLAGMYGLFLGIQACLALVFHWARRLGPRIARGTLLLSICVLAGFGGMLLTRAILG